MFRTQQNIFDDAVGKATDENLTSENWEYILDVCDRASSEASGPKDVVQALIKRMGHRNANVQLYTLEVRQMPLPVLQTIAKADRPAIEEWP